MTTAAKPTSVWRLALIGFVAMMAQDMLATAMVIFESRMNAPVSGLFDSLGWFAGLASNVVALGEILDHPGAWRSRRALIIMAAITAANFAGTFAGVAISKAIIGR